MNTLRIIRAGGSGRVAVVLVLAALLAFAAVPVATFAQGQGNSFGQQNAGATGGNQDTGGGSVVVPGGSTDTGGSDTSGSSGYGSGNTYGGGSSTTTPGNKPDTGETTAGNNLSFPAVAADGFGIAPIASTTFGAVYTGPYTGLTTDEMAALSGHNWYAQKLDTNRWQAGFTTAAIGVPVPVFGIDWGDNLESVHPIVGNPFRLELSLFEQLATPLMGYTMAVLANPSSPDEVQGTNRVTYDSDLAAVVSSRPILVIQYLGAEVGNDLVWSGTGWARGSDVLPITAVKFGPELNVAGKYVYGGSEGGWKPAEAGMYRITMYFPGSDITLASAVVGNYTDWVTTVSTTTDESETEEPRAAQPVVDTVHNLTYTDVQVVLKREGTPPENPGEGEEESTTVTTAVTKATDQPTDVVSVTSSSSAVADRVDEAKSVAASCTPYLTDYLAMGKDNDPTQVVRLQVFLNQTLDNKVPVTGYFGQLTFDAVKYFQVLHADKILLPWIQDGYTDASLYKGTGNVYYTTLATINEIQCR